MYDGWRAVSRLALALVALHYATARPVKLSVGSVYICCVGLAVFCFLLDWPDWLRAFGALEGRTGDSSSGVA